jgi:hypothetical protein
VTDRQLLAECYRRVKREPKEGTIAEALLEHAQACGLVAYVLGVHPDEVAKAAATEFVAELEARA